MGGINDTVRVITAERQMTARKLFGRRIEVRTILMLF